MRAEWLLSVESNGEIVPRGPIPKIAILSADMAIGVAGSDPAGGFRNIHEMWHATKSASSLREAIVEDGDLRRDWLMVESSGSILTYSGGTWTESTHGFGWIGDTEARRRIDPEPFDFDISAAPPYEQADAADWARSRGFSEAGIEATLDPATSAQIGAEAGFGNATRSSVPTVAGPALEARMVNGRFTFNKQSKTQVFGGTRVETSQQAAAALTGDGMVSHWIRSRCSYTFPAQPVVDFIDSQKSLVFWLDHELGYGAWFGDTSEVPSCSHDQQEEES